MNNGILDLMRGIFKQGGHKCADGGCHDPVVGFNVHNKGNELECATWACVWHIRADGEWLVEEIIISG